MYLKESWDEHYSLLEAPLKFPLNAASIKAVKAYDKSNSNSKGFSMYMKVIIV